MRFMVLITRHAKQILDKQNKNLNINKIKRSISLHNNNVMRKHHLNICRNREGQCHYHVGIKKAMESTKRKSSLIEADAAIENILC